MHSPERVIRERDLKDYDGLGHSARWYQIEKGTYPPPIKLSDKPIRPHKAWLASDIAAWQAWRAAKRDARAPKGSSWKDYLNVSEIKKQEV
jgi:predicted DNA-binding transcriptional regulator AlpA